MSEVEVTVQYWDLAGAQTVGSVRKSFVRGAQVVLLFYNVTDPSTLEKLNEWVTYLSKEGADSIKLIVIVGSKADLNAIVSEEDVDRKIQQWQKEFNVQYESFRCSAKEPVPGLSPHDIHRYIMKQLVLGEWDPETHGEEADMKYLFKAILVGENGVGKTSFRRRVIGQQFSQDHLMTVGADFAANRDVISVEELLKERELDKKPVESEISAPEPMPAPPPDVLPKPPQVDNEKKMSMEEIPPPNVKPPLKEDDAALKVTTPKRSQEKPEIKRSMKKSMPPGGSPSLGVSTTSVGKTEEPEKAQTEEEAISSIAETSSESATTTTGAGGGGAEELTASAIEGAMANLKKAPAKRKEVAEMEKEEAAPPKETPVPTTADPSSETMRDEPLAGLDLTSAPDESEEIRQPDEPEEIEPVARMSRSIDELEDDDKGEPEASVISQPAPKPAPAEPPEPVPEPIPQAEPLAEVSEVIDEVDDVPTEDEQVDDEEHTEEEEADEELAERVVDDEEEYEVVAEKVKQVGIDYYDRMIPSRHYQLTVTISTETIEKIRKKIKITTGERQARIVDEITVDAETEYIRIVPMFPGCLVAPSEHLVDVTEEDQVAEFYITPLVYGKINEAIVQFWGSGKLLGIISTPTKVSNPWTSRIIAVGGLIGSTLPKLTATGLGLEDLPSLIIFNQSIDLLLFLILPGTVASFGAAWLYRRLTRPRQASASDQENQVFSSG